MKENKTNFPLNADDYELLCLIGKGATSEVYSARCKSNGKILAIKLIDLEGYPLELDYLRQEVAFWSSSQHPNIVEYYGSFITGPTLYILMEFMPGGSVSDIIRFGFPHGFTDERIIATILKANLLALQHIHSNHELHRDVKPGNTLISSTGSVKIGDFGVAATLLENGQRRRARFTIIGTPCYMAPEVLQEDIGYTEKADIWSFGIEAIELAVGTAPYSNLKPLAIVQKILNAPPPQIPNDGRFSPEFRAVVRKCLNHDAAKRPTAEELLNEPFFIKAADSRYIVNHILNKLPPVEERYKHLDHENKHKRKKSKGKKLPTWSYDMPVPPQNNSDNINVVVKGRFNIKKHSSMDCFLGGDVSNNKEQNDQNTDLKNRVDELTKRVKMLTEENEQIKEQIKNILQIVQQLSRK
ncbi:STE family protein kinase [Histomonas meleagridis]|uniref:STE family protein kinase n=1 Tax=Histomonas meleagridis TaxID=135588 RepID=UPI00355AC6D9|nr:STE family protein kinase [Histomonas meleagridis]KAH0806737.1 STE family protein kinase [Histomonas meleagridis]